MRFQSRLKRSLRANKVSGNALMEYAVPASIILLSTGLLVTLADSSSLMAGYFLSASGRSTASLKGTTLETQGLAERATGDNGMGYEGFSGASFASVSGASAGAGASPVFYSGTVTRKGGRTQSPSPEYLYK
ncbi:hypothetical protein [Vampirovibrio chlorellavorus]|uniref:hypothetical protein n=1 Tax=Vampirovibrio chlorellavorus TaxID=758823 RepID=UPI0026EA533D|nr:hypothetical protein [Vampirovibrio chlorellavorus]